MGFFRKPSWPDLLIVAKHLKTLLGLLASRLFGRLTRDQKVLWERIATAVASSGTPEIIFKSEWLGYLPFGVYCWLEHASDEGVICNIDLPFGCDEHDLAVLERNGFLEKISERRDSADAFDYSVTYRVRLNRNSVAG